MRLAWLLRLTLCSILLTLHASAASQGASSGEEGGLGPPLLPPNFPSLAPLCPPVPCQPAHLVFTDEGEASVAVYSVECSLAAPAHHFSCIPAAIDLPWSDARSLPRNITVEVSTAPT